MGFLDTSVICERICHVVYCILKTSKNYVMYDMYESISVSLC